MKQRIKPFYDLIYFFIIFVAIGLSLVYGQILETNIGEYPQYMVFGTLLPTWSIVLIPIGITLLYAYSIYIAYKNGLIDFSRKSLILIFTLLTMFFYMIVLVSVKDLTHVFGNVLPTNNGPTVNERLHSIFTFYLSLLMIYAFYALIKRTKNSKLFIELILVGIIIYAFISVFYSLATEIEKYKVVFSDKFNIFDKTYIGPDWIKSFYTIGNVFGHTVYVGALSFIFLGIISKKPWLCFVSVVFTPFVYASACRASILSTAILYIGLIIYLIYPCFKKSKWVGISYLGTLILIMILFVLELEVWQNIKFEYEGKQYLLNEFLHVLLTRMDTVRISIVEMCYKNATLKDVIYGFGYGLHLLLPRTQGSYIYYMHNTFVEYVAIGGVFYAAFIGAFFIISIYKSIKMIKAKTSLVVLFFVLILSQIAYGMFESIPVLTCNFFGAVFGVYFFLIINLEYQEYEHEIDVIQTLDPIHTVYDLDYEVKDVSESIDIEKVNFVVDEIKNYMQQDKQYSLKCVLLGEKESNELVHNNSNNYLRTYKSYYNKDEDKYYILSTKIN